MRRVTEHNARAVEGLAAGVEALADDAPREALRHACERGFFRPAEEAALMDWFGRLLTMRDALWEVIAEIGEAGGGLVAGLAKQLSSVTDTRRFLVGYAAACLLVRLDRLLVQDVATHSVTQRKLNEGSAERRIPRKHYTAIFESLSLPRNALLMQGAMLVAAKERAALFALSGDPELGAVAGRLPWLEEALDPSKAGYFQLLLGYGDHAMRRRAASTGQKTTLGVMESSGRVVAELHDRWSDKRVDDKTRERLRALLKPGDVLVTRHEIAMSNLFFPGYWPHAALYVGSEQDRERLGVTVDDEVARHWRDDRCVLEALKDGVRFRPLEETLAVDAVAVLRPGLDTEQIARAIECVAPHQGKLYNFDFDFFRSDRLVCTEVVYRAYDGAMDIPLHERAGRPTLSAEDVLDLAFDGDRFDVVAVYGAGSCWGRGAGGGGGDVSMRKIVFAIAMITMVFALTQADAHQLAAPPTVAGCPMFPEDNIWNWPVDDLPVHPMSENYIDTIGRTGSAHPDFGSGFWEGGPIGIPFVVVPGTQPKVPVSFEYADESDPGPYPIPPDAPIEGGPASSGDRHILMVDEDNCVLYETFATFPNPDGSWRAGSGAIFDLRDHALRPAGWTSADAAGLPILHGLVRYDEVAAGEIRHAIRFTAPRTQQRYVWPARHHASRLTDPFYPQMGLRMRLRADFDDSGFSPEAQVIARALKRYGMILADNGSAWFLSGAPDERWDNDNLRDLRSLAGSDFEAVDTAGLMEDPDSGRVAGAPTAVPTATEAATEIPTETPDASTPTATDVPPPTAPPPTPAAVFRVYLPLAETRRSGE